MGKLISRRVWSALRTVINNFIGAVESISEQLKTFICAGKNSVLRSKESLFSSKLIGKARPNKGHSHDNCAANNVALRSKR